MLTPEIEMHFEDANRSGLERRTEAKLHHGVLHFTALLYVETCLVRLQGTQQWEQPTKSEATNMLSNVVSLFFVVPVLKP